MPYPGTPDSANKSLRLFSDAQGQVHTDLVLYNQLRDYDKRWQRLNDSSHKFPDKDSDTFD